MEAQNIKLDCRFPPSSARLYCTCEEKSAEEGSAMTDWPEKTLADWRKLATEELKGADADCLTWQTPEGIAVKPLYTAEDLEGLATVGSLPGFAPFTPRPKAPIDATGGVSGNRVSDRLTHG